MTTAKTATAAFGRGGSCLPSSAESSPSPPFLPSLLLIKTSLVACCCTLRDSLVCLSLCVNPYLAFLPVIFQTKYVSRPSVPHCGGRIRSLIGWRALNERTRTDTTFSLSTPLFLIRQNCNGSDRPPPSSSQHRLLKIAFFPQRRRSPPLPSPVVMLPPDTAAAAACRGRAILHRPSLSERTHAPASKTARSAEPPSSEALSLSIQAPSSSRHRRRWRVSLRLRLRPPLVTDQCPREKVSLPPSRDS